MKQIENERGIFTVDDCGTLRKFQYKPMPGWSTDGNSNVHDGQNITSLPIPEGVYVLPENAFRGYRIFHVILPSTLSYLGAGAFSRCDIERMTFPEHLRIEPSAFSASIIQQLTVPENADQLMLIQLAHALRFSFVWHSSDLFASLPDFCKDIFLGKWEPQEQWQRIENQSGEFFVDADGVLMDWSAPEDNRLSEMVIPAGVKAIRGGLFQNLNLSGALHLPDTLRFVGSGTEGTCFAGSTLPVLTLPTSIQLFGTYAFGGCHIGLLTIPPGFEKSYRHIGARQFKGSCIDEIRVAPAFEDVLRETLQHAWGITFDRKEDPVWGQLSCAVLPSGDCHERLGDLMVNLLYDIAWKH